MMATLTPTIIGFMTSLTTFMTCYTAYYTQLCHLNMNDIVSTMMIHAAWPSQNTNNKWNLST
jgi:hypothetical protein